MIPPGRVKGRLPLFINNFLKGRKFTVRLDNTHSSLNPQKEGVPQGSILLPTLFTVKINSIVDTLQKELKSLYMLMIRLFTAMTICSVYLPPNRSVDVVELRQLVKQLPKPFMLLGDFNGHHAMWGCRDINPRGRIREDFLAEENLCIFNDDTTTYLHPASGSATAIDLSLCDPDLYFV